MSEQEFPAELVERCIQSMPDPPRTFEQTVAAVLREIDYAELVAVLEEARLQIKYLHEKFQETGSGNSVLSRINAVLRKDGA